MAVALILRALPFDDLLSAGSTYLDGLLGA